MATMACVKTLISATHALNFLIYWEREVLPVPLFPPFRTSWPLGTNFSPL